MQKGLWVIVAAALMLGFAACPQSGEGDDNGETERPSVVKKNINGRTVINTVWCEGAWQDPRMILGYRLENSNIPYFDNYVMLYGGRIANRDCVNNPWSGDEHCKKQGLHLHHPSRQWKILEEWEKYYKPIQENGQRFIMALVPAGGGVAHGTLYSWPMEDVAPWASLYPNDPVYPFGEEATQGFINEILDAVEKYNLDGIGFDDEYGNMGDVAGKGYANVYPSSEYYSSSSAQDAAWERGGKNMFRFAYELKKQVKERFNKDFFLENYEIRYGQRMPPSMVIDGKTLDLRQVVDISYNAFYGAFNASSGSGSGANHMPRSAWGPCSIDIGSASAHTPQPPANSNGIVQSMKDHLAGNYGAIMYFSLVSLQSYKTANQYKDYFGTGNTNPCDYFSMISEILFGERTIYVGADYQLDW